MAVVEHAAATGPSFALSDEQKALRELAREFAEKEIRPKAAEYDEHQTHAAEVVAKAHEVGLMNLNVPAEYGGPELSLFEGAIVSEELCWGCAASARRSSAPASAPARSSSPARMSRSGRGSPRSSTSRCSARSALQSPTRDRTLPA